MGSGPEKMLNVAANGVLTAGVAVFSDSAPPPKLTDLAAKITSTPAFIIYAAHGQGGEQELSPDYYRALGGRRRSGRFQPAVTWRRSPTSRRSTSGGSLVSSTARFLAAGSRAGTTPLEVSRLCVSTWKRMTRGKGVRMHRSATLTVVGLAMVFALSHAVPAIGGPSAFSSASPLSIAKKALKTAKKADRRARQARKKADQSLAKLGRAQGFLGANVQTVSSAPKSIAPGAVEIAAVECPAGTRCPVGRLLGDRAGGERVLQPQEWERLGCWG